MKPDPKPVKKHKDSMSLSEFRKKYGKKTTTKKTKSQAQKFYGSPAWKWFRRYQLTRLCDPKTLTVRDYTAIDTSFLPIKDKNTHLGHFVKVFEAGRSNMAVAFDERNSLPQNGQVNRYGGGAQDRMAIVIDDLYGQGTSRELVIQSKLTRKIGEIELKELAETYRSKTYKALDDKGIEKWW